MIYRFSMPCPELDPLDFLHGGAGQLRTFFSKADGKLTFAGFGLTGQGRDTLSQIETLNNAREAKLFGGFAFDSQALTGAWTFFPEESYWLHEFEYESTPDGNWVTINSKTKEGLEEKLLNLIKTLPDYQLTDSPFETHALIHRTQWDWMVKQAIEKIEVDDLKKIVLARPLCIRSPKNIDPLAGLTRLNSAYPKTYRFLVEPQAGYAFIGATPEQLVRIKDGVLETTALAGSAPRGDTPEADARLAEGLLNSEKDRHEHQLVVDDLLVELDDIVTNLEIAESPIIHALPNVQHLLTPIRAEIDPARHVLDIVKALHPTPALGGLPRKPAMDLICELETYPRGWYGAPLGWFDAAGNGEFVVAIRSAVISKNTAWAYAGAGIVTDSDPAKEWDETLVKLQPMLTGLGVN